MDESGKEILQTDPVLSYLKARLNYLKKYYLDEEASHIKKCGSQQFGHFGLVQKSIEKTLGIPSELDQAGFPKEGVKMQEECERAVDWMLSGNNKIPFADWVKHSYEKELESHNHDCKDPRVKMMIEIAHEKLEKEKNLES